MQKSRKAKKQAVFLGADCGQGVSRLHSRLAFKAQKARVVHYLVQNMHTWRARVGWFWAMERELGEI